MKRLLMTRNLYRNPRVVVYLAILTAAVLLTVWCMVSVISYAGSQASDEPAAAASRRLPIYGVNTQEKKIALTFDCAWENSDTEILLEILETNDVKATFFMTGDWCTRYPEDVRRFWEAGHDIENHSYAHPHVASISRETLMEDTQKCEETIESLTGSQPVLYRAPYGEYSDDMLALLEDDMGYRVIQWDCDSMDWKGRDAADMIRTIENKLRPGSILLFHNDTENTPQTLRQLIPLLKGEGYEFVLVRDLILWEDYTLDHEGRQSPCEEE